MECAHKGDTVEEKRICALVSSAVVCSATDYVH